MNLPGVMVYGDTLQEALVKAKALALRVLADQVEASQQPDTVNNISFLTAILNLA
ncbi:MAG: type II toxin-antitoxin system HicB family antitoxin [Chloroflexota bacterium]